MVQVRLDVRNENLTAIPEFVSDHVVRSESGTACSMKDHAAERSRNDVDARQFQTILTPSLPRMQI